MRKEWKLKANDYKYIEGNDPETGLARKAQQRLMEFLTTYHVGTNLGHTPPQVMIHLPEPLFKEICKDLGVYPDSLQNTTPKTHEI